MKVNINKSEFFYFLALTLFFTTTFLVQTTFVYKYPFLYSLKNNVVIISIFILLLKFVTENHILDKKFFVIISLVVLMLISVYHIETYRKILNLIAILLFIINQKNVDIKKILIYYTFLLGTGLLLTQLLYSMDVIPNTDIRERNGVLRESLGYIYTSFSSNFYMHFLCIYIFIRKSKLKIFELLLLTIPAIYYYSKTNTKSAFVFSIILIILVIIFMKIKFNKYLEIINKYILILSSIIPIYLAYVFTQSNSFLYDLDKMLTGRLYLGTESLLTYGISIFGQQLEWVFEDSQLYMGSKYLYVDSSFLNIAINFGIIWVILLCIGFYKISAYNITKNVYYTITFSIIVLHSIFDPQFLELHYNPFLLILGLLFTEKKLLSGD